MPDLGYRSVEVNCTNDTRGNLIIQAATTGTNCSWVQGEQATQGAPLNQYNNAKWGVLTNDIDAAATAQVQLTGLGSWPVTIVFFNNEAGTSNCTVAPNDAVKGIVQQIDTGEQSHTLFSVQLIPL